MERIVCFDQGKGGSILVNHTQQWDLVVDTDRGRL